MGDSYEILQEKRREALINPLRSEIVESEKARIDFLKYKLFAVGVLGSIGLSLDHTQSGSISLDHVYILGIIPLVCLYVDLLCYHNTLRIFVIGQYFSKMGCPYENFISKAGNALYDIGLFLFRRRPSNIKKEFKDITDKDSSAYVSLTKIKEDNRKEKVTNEEKDNNLYKSCAGYFFELEDWALQWSTLFLSCLITILGIGIAFLFQPKDKDFLPLLLVIPGIAGMILSYFSKRRYEDRRDTLFAVSRMLQDDNRENAEE